MAEEATEHGSPESRLYAAGFTRQLEFWRTPDGRAVLNTEEAIAGLDSGQIRPAEATMAIPDQPGLRPRTDDEIDRLLRPARPAAPPWLEPLAELVAEKLAAGLGPVAERRSGAA